MEMSLCMRCLDEAAYMIRMKPWICPGLWKMSLLAGRSVDRHVLSEGDELEGIWENLHRLF